jgi:hypothetical protein
VSSKPEMKMRVKKRRKKKQTVAKPVSSSSRTDTRISDFGPSDEVLNHANAESGKEKYI